MESSTKYLEETLKLKVNREKSRTVSVFAIRKFKFLGFVLGRTEGIYIRVMESHGKKAKSFSQLTSQEQIWEYHPSYGKDKSLYKRMAELLWNSYEEQHQESMNGWLYRRIGCVSGSSETAKVEKKTNGSGNARVSCL